MSLVADSSSSRSSSSGQKKLFRALVPLMPVTGLMRTPCGVCPVSARYIRFIPPYKCVQPLRTGTRDKWKEVIAAALCPTGGSKDREREINAYMQKFCICFILLAFSTDNTLQKLVGCKLVYVVLC